MNYKEVKQVIEAVEWTFAKTYADSYPHEYTLRERVGDDELFDDLIRFMREKAKIKNFYGKQYLYFELDGKEYWEMGRPTRAVKVLNRAPIDDSKEYRSEYPKPTEKDKERLLEKLKQRDRYVEYLLDKNNRTNHEEVQLKYLLNSAQGSGNVIDHSKKKVNIFEMSREKLKEHIKNCKGIKI